MATEKALPNRRQQTVAGGGRKDVGEEESCQDGGKDALDKLQGTGDEAIWTGFGRDKSWIEQGICGGGEREQNSNDCQCWRCGQG
jgi:hypothetical protein